MNGVLHHLDTGLASPSPYYLGNGMLEAFPLYLAEHDFDRLFFVTSPFLDSLFGSDFRYMLKAAGLHCETLHVPEGERNKSWRALVELCERLVDRGLTRQSIIIVMGGGMLGNLAGLAASLIYRGVRYIEVPTTLMAQTDGTLSNKQAVNGRSGKNQFGTYHPPLFVWADAQYLRHEPIRQIKSAVVEGVKNGFVHDGAWLDTLQRALAGGLDGMLEDPVELTLALIDSKRSILARDPSEKGYGVVLEYGHTFGHAIEWLSEGQLLHGEAVAIGMCAAARLGRHLGILPEPVVERHRQVLGDLLGVPTEIPSGLDPLDICRAMRADNKRTGKELRFLILEDIGRLHAEDRGFLVPVPESDVLCALGAGVGV